MSTECLRVETRMVRMSWLQGLKRGVKWGNGGGMSTYEEPTVACFLH